MDLFKYQSKRHTVPLPFGKYSRSSIWIFLIWLYGLHEELTPVTRYPTLVRESDRKYLTYPLRNTMTTYCSHSVGER